MSQGVGRCPRMNDGALAPPTPVLASRFTDPVVPGKMRPDFKHALLMLASVALLTPPRTPWLVWEFTVTVYAARITDVRKTSAAIKLLQKRYPLAAFAHCKRVRKSRDDRTLAILLCDVADLPGGGTVEELIAVQGLDDVISAPFLVEIPSSPPLTREQYNAAVAMWSALPSPPAPCSQRACAYATIF